MVPHPVEYAIVTVKLGREPLEPKQAFQEIKSALCLHQPDIDESYGAVPLGRGDEYVVLIEQNLAQKMKDDRHPNIVGVFANPKLEPFSPSGPKGPGWCGPCF